MPLKFLIDEHRSSWSQSLESRDRRLELVPPPEPVIGDYDPFRLGQGLDVFVAWRAAVGSPGQPLRLRWWAETGRFVVEWSDPFSLISRPVVGQGFLSDWLALPFLARIVTAHGGSIDVDVETGLLVKLRWPLDVRDSIE